MTDRENHTRSRGSRLGHWIVLAVLVAAGCSDDNPNLLPIDSIVELRISESAGRLTISGQTQRHYPCLGYQIVHRDFATGSGFRPSYQIDLLGVRPPGGACPAVLGPATSTSSFLMPPVGTHSIQVTANGTVATAMLEVTTDSLIVTGGNGPWVLWPDPRVSRP